MNAFRRLFHKSSRESDTVKKASAILCFLICLTFVFSSCEKNIPSKEFTPQKTFSLHMKAKKDKRVFEADVICRNYNDITIEFTYPESIAGFCVSTSEDGYSLNITGVTDTLSREELNEAALLNILTDAINVSVFANHGSFSETENGFTAEILIDSIPVTVSFTKDGYIEKINAANTGFSAEFEKSG